MFRILMVAALAAAMAAPVRADGPTPGRKKRVAGVATMLGGAVLVVAGAVLGSQAFRDSQSVSALFQSGGIWNQGARNLDSEGRRDDVAQKVLYPIGSALILSGLAVAVVGWWQDKHAPTQPTHALFVAPTQGGAQASWSVSF